MTLMSESVIGRGAEFLGTGRTYIWLASLTGFTGPGLVLGASSERKSSLLRVRPLSFSLPSYSSSLHGEG